MSVFRGKKYYRIALLMIIFVMVLGLSAASIGAQEGPEKADGGLTAVPDAVSKAGDVQYSTAKEEDPLVEDSPFAQAEAKNRRAEDLREVSIIVLTEGPVDAAALEAASGGQVVYEYSEVFDGAAMILDGESVDKVASISGVKTIYLDEKRELDTEVSPDFIGATTLWNSLGGADEAGEGVVVGVLDTGIWPEHPSYADPDPSGKPYPAPPGGPYACEFGNTASNPDDAPFTCNNKLIGAYDFTILNKALNGLPAGEFDSARDADGHGTHTSSTAAGNAGVAASIFGVPRGVVSGIAPRAHVIMYKVCIDGCYVSDSVAAVNQAIVDGVDVLNFSIGGGSNPYDDAGSLAFLSAYENGIFVAASAGNSGPGPDTVAHREPWTTTVGASTSNRHFISTVTLEADGGAELVLEGATVTAGIATPTPVIFPPAGEELCLDPFAPGTFAGEIVICQRGVIARVAKSSNVADGGAGGMLLYNPVIQGLATDNHFIPSVHLEGDAGVELLDFMAANTGVTGTFTMGEATPVPGDMMAAFSSRGGPAQSLGISKPDITAPGVQVLAGHTPLPRSVDGGLPGELFQSIQGTSMSSPEVAGSAALVKAAHPDWTPGQIKSALMMTSKTAGVVKEDGVTPADAFDYGSGRVDLSKAGKASITISESRANFEALQYELWNANLPSLYHPVMPGQITVQRTIQNETNKNQNWKLTPSAPDDVKISVPKRVKVGRNGEATFEITVDARLVPLGETRFATIEFKKGWERLTFPVTIVRGQPSVKLDKVCDPAEIARRETTSCTIAIENTSFDEAAVSLSDALPRELRILRHSIEGADRAGNGIKFDGTLYGAEAPLVNVAVDPLASPAGYLPLAGFGPNLVDSSDESIDNWNIPSFTYAGESYSQIGIVSNGYIVVGGGTADDVEYINTDLPNPAAPNNILAPFWTDLNPEFGGRIILAVLTDGINDWTIVEWENVFTYGDELPNTFQVWIGSNGDADASEDISFTYGPSITGGDGGWLTVGAENAYGNSGGTVYFDGVGTPPAPSYPNPPYYEVDVFSVPGAPGETHTITFDAKGVRKGDWLNCAEMTSPLYQGVNIACSAGTVTK